MMKWTLSTLVAFALMGTASANVNFVDFKGAFPGTTASCDATNTSTCIVSGVSFSYATADPLKFGTALVGANGIDISPGRGPVGGPAGTIDGILIMTIGGGPVTGGMSFDYSVFGATTNDFVSLFLYNQAQLVDFTFGSLNLVTGTGNVVTGTGSIAFQPVAAWDNAQISFLTAAASGVNINNVFYDTGNTVTPEPASFLLPMGMGLLGLGFARRFSRRRS